MTGVLILQVPLWETVNIFLNNMICDSVYDYWTKNKPNSSYIDHATRHAERNQLLPVLLNSQIYVV